MKIDVKELRKIVREVLVEEMDSVHDRPTIPASASAGEKQFQQDTGGQKWGNPKAQPQQKTKNDRVWSVVSQSMGGGMDNRQQQALRGELDSFLKSKDPSEVLIATAEQLANEFSQSKKSAPQG